MVTKVSIEEIIADVAEVLGPQIVELGKDSRFGSPGWDSLAQLKIIIVLEEKYGLKISDFEQDLLFSIEGIFHAVTM